MSEQTGEAGTEGPPPVAYRRSPFRARPQDPLHERASRSARSIPEYRPPTARRDLIAGLTVAALALPSGMAYAEVAGLPPVNGLYALLLPTVLYTFLGSSRQLIVGPGRVDLGARGRGAAPARRRGKQRGLGARGDARAARRGLLPARVGGAARLARRLLLAAGARSGYIHGVAVVLVCGQLGKLLGVDIDATKPIGQVVEAIQELGDASGTTVLVSAVALGALLVARLLPAAASRRADRRARVDRRVVGRRPRRPTVSPSSARSRRACRASAIPTPPLGDVADLVPAAIGIFLVSFADGILTARSFAGKRNQHVRANQELLAFSGMSAAAGVTQGFPLGASGSRTAVNDQMGARTQIAGPRRRGRDRARAAVPHDADVVPAEGRARRGDRLGRDRPRRSRRLARRSGS